MGQLSSLPHRSAILQFTGSPFALEDLRSVSVSHLHNKGGTKSALHTGDYTSLQPESQGVGEAQGASTTPQPPAKSCQQTPCLIEVFHGHLELLGFCYANVNSCPVSSERHTRENPVSWLLVLYRFSFPRG